MSVFIGRKIQETTERWLSDHLVEYMAVPLIQIGFISPKGFFIRKSTDQETGWMITSNYAAEWLLYYFKTVGFRRTDRIYCISEKQKKKLADLECEIFVSNRKNRASLELLIESENKSERLVFLHGDRTPYFKKTDVENLLVYKNNLLKPCISKSFNAYLFFSPSGIESFEKGGNKVCNNAVVIVVGDTTASSARNYFSNEIVVSEKQNELEMLELAYSVLKEKKKEKRLSDHAKN